MNGKFYKKGSIVPRSVGATASDRKAQHRLKFGCDVIVLNRRIQALTEGDIFEFYGVKRIMKNGTFKRVNVLVEGIHVIGLGSCKGIILSAN